MEGGQGLWLNSSYCWDPATLEARPVKSHTPLPRKTTGAPVCQVEGCGLDLSSLRHFFRKQRICEQHARADVVTDSAGRQLRFCQQCTRLEPLANFNGGRRSCKTSLAKRQARAHRGKAPSSPDSSPERAIARAPSSSDGEAASAAASSWRGTSRHSSGGGTVSKRSRASAVPSASTSNPAAALAGSTHGDPPRLAAPAPAPAPPPAPLPPDDMLWSSSLCGSDIEELLALDAEALADALRVPQAPGPCPDAPTHPLAAHQPWSGGGGGSVLGGSQPALGGGPPAAGPPLFGAAPGVPASGVPTLWLPAAPGLAPAAQPGTMVGPQAAPPLSGPEQWGAQPEAAAVASMRAAASGVAAGVRHSYPLHVITRFSLKIFGVNPDGLPPHLRAELLAALRVSPTVLEGAIRCGCTHLIVDVLLSEEERSRLATPPRLAAAVQHLRRRDAWRGRPSGSPAVVAQLGQLVALGTAAGGGGDCGADRAPPLPCIHMGESQLLPRLVLAGPLATTAAASRGTFRLAAAGGAADAAPPPGGLAAALRCRCHARHVGLAVTTLRQQADAGLDDCDASFGDDTSDEEEAAGRDEEHEAGVRRRGAAAPRALPPAAPPGMTLLEAWAPEAAGEDGWGLYEFEVASGSLLSEAVPVLVLPDSEAVAAAELCQLQQAGVAAPGGTAPTAILRLVAAVLRFLHARQAAAASGAGSSADAACAAAYPPAAVARVAAVARRLVTLCVRARWPALLRMLLPAAAADLAAAAAALRQLDALSAPAPSILHLAVASGEADSVAALRVWADQSGAALHDGGDEMEAGGGGGEPPLGLLLLAASMGPALDAGMAGQLAGLLGSEGLARAADAPGPSGWSPRRVAAATGADALLAAMPPQPEPSPAASPPERPESASGSGDCSSAAEEEEEAEGEEGQGAMGKLPCSERLQQKLRALEEDWAGSCTQPPGKPAAACGVDVHAAHAKARGPKAARREPRPPSHDASLLADLMREMHVPREAGAAPPGSPTPGLGSGACISGAAGGAGHGLAASHPLAASAAGAAVAVVAALVSVAVRWAW